MTVVLQEFNPELQIFFMKIACKKPLVKKLEALNGIKAYLK